MHGPWSRIAPPHRRPLLIVLLALSLGFFGALTVQGRPLFTPAAPLGILSYEFAWNHSRADEILRSWSPLVDTARRQLWLDFPFLTVYPLLLSLAVSMAPAPASGRGSRARALISWAVLAAGPLDAAENIFLLRMLDLGAGGELAMPAAACAAVKFFLVLAAAGNVAFRCVRPLWNRKSERIPGCSRRG
jgi:hypothetical protein